MGTPVKGRGRGRGRSGRAGERASGLAALRLLGPRRAGSGVSSARGRAGTDSGTRREACARGGLEREAPRPGRYGRGPQPSRAPQPGGPSRPSRAAAPAVPGLCLRAARGAGPDAPWLRNGPGQGRGRRAYLHWCGGAAIASRGCDLRRWRWRRRQQSRRGGRFLQEGVGSARPPARPPPAAPGPAPDLFWGPRC